MNPRNSTANIAATNLISKALGLNIWITEECYKSCVDFWISAQMFEPPALHPFCLCFNPI